MKIAHICKPCYNAAVLTCVTNAGGMGPGHTALIVDDYVYTFERFVAGWTSTAESGWVKIRSDAYFKKNTHRPVVVQELNFRVDPSLVYEYISLRDYDDADYLSSGVCSQEGLAAVNAGAQANRDPSGFNTPYRVAYEVQRAGFVDDVYYVFPNSGGSRRLEVVLFATFSARVFGTLREETHPPVLAW